MKKMITLLFMFILMTTKVFAVTSVTIQDANGNNQGSSSNPIHVAFQSSSGNIGIGTLLPTQTSNQINIDHAVVTGNATTGNTLIDLGSSLPQSSILATNFSGTTLPNGWLNTGSFTFSNGAINPTASGTPLYLTFGEPTGLENILLTADVTITNVNSEAGIILEDDQPSAGHDKGLLCTLDGINQRLVIYQGWDTGSLTTALTQAYTVTAGHSYRLIVNKGSADNITFSVYDDATAATASITGSNQSNQIGWATGYPGVVAIQGTAGYFTFNRFELSHYNQKRSKVLVFGDSMVGYYGVAGYGVVSNRFATLLQNALNGSVAISGVGGDTTTQYIARYPLDALLSNPEYILWLGGYNDGGSSAPIANMQLFAASCKAHGSIPVFATLPPTTSSGTFQQTINTWIRSSGYKYADFYTALSIGNTTTALGNSSYFAADGIHPNYTGEALEYAQIQAQLPEFFTQENQSTLTVNNVPVSGAVQPYTMVTSPIYVNGNNVGVGTIGSTNTLYVTQPATGTQLTFYDVGSGGRSMVFNVANSTINDNTALYINKTGGGVTTIGGNGHKVGIGISGNPSNPLDIAGGTALGSDYASAYTAPTNGLIVEANVGIGTSSPGTNILETFTTGGAPVQFYDSGSGGRYLTITPNAGKISESNAGLYLNKDNNNAITLGGGGGNVGIGTTGNPRMFLDISPQTNPALGIFMPQSGNVGIGTTVTLGGTLTVKTCNGLAYLQNGVLGTCSTITLAGACTGSFTAC